MSAIKFEMRPGYDAGAVMQNITANVLRGLPQVKVEAPKNKSISICGNGPTLRSTYPTEGPIVACNGAWKKLKEYGILPQFIVAADPSEENIAWFEDCPDEPIYLLASRVSQKIFNLLTDKKVVIWHVGSDEELKCRVTGPLIDSGSTIALKAINLFHALGYTHFDLYGVDSSYALDGADHAAEQPWGEKEKTPFQIQERMFISCPWMVAQAQEAVDQFARYACNYTVDVHGSGLLAAYVDEYSLDVEYDLNTAPASYDFLSWMTNLKVEQEKLGYPLLRVRFKAGNKNGFRINEPIYIETQKRQDLFNNVCRPGLRLFGAKEGGSKPSGAKVPYVIYHTTHAFRKGATLPKMVPNYEAQAWAEENFSDEPYVITLREMDTYWPERNSNVDAWKQFAKTLDRRVIFVRDYYKAEKPLEDFEICPEASLDVHKRLALYRKAKMNFMVSNGPCILAHYTDNIPYLCFMVSPSGYVCHRPDWIETYLGIAYGGQYPWAAKNQRLIWANDTLENIEEAFRKVQ